MLWEPVSHGAGGWPPPAPGLLTHNTVILGSVSLPEKLHVSLFKFCSEFRRWAEVSGGQTTVLLEESAVSFWLLVCL